MAESLFLVRRPSGAIPKNPVEYGTFRPSLLVGLPTHPSSRSISFPSGVYLHNHPRGHHTRDRPPRQPPCSFYSRPSVFHRSDSTGPQGAANALASRLEIHKRRRLDHIPPKKERPTRHEGHVEREKIRKYGMRHVAEYHLVSEKPLLKDYEIDKYQKRKN